MNYKTAVYSGKGGREYNEDSIYVEKQKDGVVAILADGLGGHGGGNIASQMVVETLAEDYKEKKEWTKEAVSQYFEHAHSNILKIQTTDCQMKSTAVMLICNGNQRMIAHTGDSRGYYFQNGKMIFQTIDHSVSQMAVLSGEIRPEQIRFHSDRNKLLYALGGERKIKVDVQPFEKPLKVDEAFLLCSDGFWEYVTEMEMTIDLLKARTPEEWISYMLARLGRRIDGKNDNLSVIAVFAKEG